MQKFLNSETNYKIEGGYNRPEEKKLKNCWSLQTSLLCIVGELAEGGSVAVVVGDSEM